MSLILPTPLVFISGYANTQNVFYCLNIYTLNVWHFTWDSLMGQFFYVITLDQHVIHRRTRVIHLGRQLSRSLEPTAYHSPGGSQMDAQSK